MTGVLGCREHKARQGERACRGALTRKTDLNVLPRLSLMVELGGDDGRFLSWEVVESGLFNRKIPLSATVE